MGLPQTPSQCESPDDHGQSEQWGGECVATLQFCWKLSSFLGEEKTFSPAQGFIIHPTH